MKKFVLISMILLFISPCYAGGVGYINYEKVAANYQFAKASMREIETKGNEIHQYFKGICPACKQQNENQGN